MTRGVLYISFPGDKPTAAMLDRSISSLAETHPGLPYHIAKLPDGTTLLDKAGMFDLSPFDETLFLDADTIVMGPLGYGFEKASRHGLACCICECPWARRYLCFEGDAVEYNTGVIFFSRKAKPTFDAWRDCVQTIDSSIVFNGPAGRARMPLNDQAGFAKAIESTGFNPFVLPLNWNFRPIWHKTAFGPLKIWHDYSNPPRQIADWNAIQSDPDAVITCLKLA